MSKSYFLCVAICTYNRAEYLEKCLSSLVLQDGVKEDVEIFVIDNNSSDSTNTVAIEYQKQLSNLKIFKEEQVGLSAARNRALIESSSEYIAYLDDDAVADAYWLNNLIASAKEHIPDCLGGRIKPIWVLSRPAWLDEKLEGYYSVLNYSDKPCKMIYPNHPWGANITFKSATLNKIGGFPNELGRVKGRLLSGEESWVCEKIYKLGGKVWYDPKISVGHYIPKERINPSWIRKRIFWGGVSKALHYSMNEGVSIADCRLMGFRLFVKTLFSPRVILWLIISFFCSGAISKGKKGLSRVGQVVGLLTIKK